jgi:ABC-type multidrug transport system fused ATPase/permease subunit
MDRIIVMENGKIIEEGSHLSLLRKKGRYAKLFKMQSDGYIQNN